MLDKIPDEVKNIYQKIAGEGHDIYLVGGCVRDLLLGNHIKDWDMATSAKPEDIERFFENAYYDNQFGTVGVPVEVDSVNQVVEVTTFRSDGVYSDHRRPDSVEWGKSIEEDLKRRDFTINAIALKLTEDGFDLIDPHNGQEDMENRIIRSVGDADIRFNEDALRMMRAVRLASQLGFGIESKTLDSIKNNSKLLDKIALERVRDELIKLMSTSYPYEGIVLLRNTNLLEVFLPALLEGIDVSQVRPGRHHTTDVYTHNLMSLKFCPSRDPIVRFSALIHDIGKPRSVGYDSNGYIVFHNHEIVGANMAKTISDRLRLSKKDKNKVYILVRHHMFSVDEHTTDSAIRRFIRKVGVENIKDMIDLRVADRLGSGSTSESWRLKLFKDRIEEQLKPAPFSINDLKVDGNDIIKELNIKPSRQVGQILQKLFEEVDDNLELNNREYLLKRIHDIDNSTVSQL